MAWETTRDMKIHIIGYEISGGSGVPQVTAHPISGYRATKLYVFSCI
ncbi:hypothetical protein LINPERHAP1_LOCUS36891 [Linum perenne]